MVPGPRVVPLVLACLLAIGPTLTTALAHEDHDSTPEVPADTVVPTGVEDRPLPEDVDLEDVGNYGGDVALSEDGQLLAVGADLTDVGSKWNAGSVYVLERGQDGQWTPLISLTAPSPQKDGGFGDAVAFGPDVLAVGAPFTAGSGLVFTYPIGELASGDPRAEVVEPHSEDEAGRFGNTLALSDGRLAVGDNTPRVVSVYERVEGAWTWQTSFGSNASRPSGSFGADDTVALDGDILVAGDTSYSNASLPGDAGAAFVYHYDAETDEWHHEQTLASPNPKPDGGFGRVALAAETLAIGEAGRFTDHGRLHVYEAAMANRTNWDHQATFHPSDGSGNLGHTVAATEDVVVAGAPHEHALPRGVDLFPYSPRELGAMYWYHATEDGWEQTTFMRAPVPSPESFALERFGRSLAISGEYAVAASAGSLQHPERYDPSLLDEEPDWQIPGRVTVFGPDADTDHLADTREVEAGTPIDDPDADDDGLADGIEVVRWLSDPHDADTDNDTLSDGYEAWTTKTQTRDPDTDGDGFSDDLEAHGVQVGGAQLVPSSDPNDHRSAPANEGIIPVITPFENPRRDLSPTPPVDQPGHWPTYTTNTIDEGAPTIS